MLRARIRKPRKPRRNRTSQERTGACSGLPPMPLATSSAPVVKIRRKRRRELEGDVGLMYNVSGYPCPTLCCFQVLLIHASRTAFVKYNTPPIYRRRLKCDNTLRSSSWKGPANVAKSRSGCLGPLIRNQGQCKKGPNTCPDIQLSEMPWACCAWPQKKPVLFERRKRRSRNAWDYKGEQHTNTRERTIASGSVLPSSSYGQLHEEHPDAAASRAPLDVAGLRLYSPKSHLRRALGDLGGLVGTQFAKSVFLGRKSSKATVE